MDSESPLRYPLLASACHKVFEFDEVIGDIAGVACVDDPRQSRLRSTFATALLAAAFGLAPGAFGQGQELHPPRAVSDEGPPAWLPRYDVEMRLDLQGHKVQVRQRVSWTNTSKRPTSEIIFNA